MQVGRIEATISPKSALSYSIVGGDDGARFLLDGADLYLSSSYPPFPEYNFPRDLDGDGVYEVEVEAATAAGEREEFSVRVNVASRFPFRSQMLSFDNLVDYSDYHSGSSLLVRALPTTGWIARGYSEGRVNLDLLHAQGGRSYPKTDDDILRFYPATVYNPTSRPYVELERTDGEPFTALAISVKLKDYFSQGRKTQLTISGFRPGLADPVESHAFEISNESDWLILNLYDDYHRYEDVSRLTLSLSTHGVPLFINDLVYAR